MRSKRDQIFSESGPVYLINILDWRNANHRRSIAASLLKGTSTLERDRQKKRQGPHALAPPWWESFNFRLIRTLVDGKDPTIFGAVYQYQFPNSTTSSHNQNPPNYVIAFRGTIMRPKSISHDLKLNFRVMVNRLHNCSSFRTGLQVVQNIVQYHGVSNIWLAGHSLGSAIALTIGRDMVKIGIHLETYLFNPPFASLPVDKINNAKLELGIRCAHSVITAGLAFTVNMMSTSTNYRPSDNDDTFTKLCGWTPYLFVNPSDLICSGYLGYFDYIEKMVESGAKEMARIVIQNSIRSIIATALGKESEPSQNLPSACVITNSTPRSYSKKLAHGVSQWWAPDLQCNYKRYQFW